MMIYPSGGGEFSMQTMDFQTTPDGKPRAANMAFFNASMAAVGNGTLIALEPLADEPALARAGKQRYYYFARSTAGGLDVRRLNTAGIAFDGAATPGALARLIHDNPTTVERYGDPPVRFRLTDPHRDRQILQSLLPPGFSTPAQ